MDPDRDAGFVAELVASPGDDGPRLVYADWLADRDDPRAAYLRAELAWATTPDGPTADQARRLADGLDPVWVARVSRPPLGVCCDRVRFEQTGPPPTAADLDVVEQRLGTALPAQWRAFLLNTNGGTPSWPELPDPDDPDLPLCVGQFYGSLAGDEDRDLEEQAAWVRSIWENYYASRVPFRLDGMLPIADTLHDLGLLLIGVAPASFGRVFHIGEWARNLEWPSPPAEFAPSLAKLLARLRPEPDDDA